MPKLLAAMVGWSRIDMRYKHIDVRKGFVTVLSRLVVVPQGRTAFIGANGTSTIMVG